MSIGFLRIKWISVSKPVRVDYGRPASPASASFTLIELLAVVAIVLVLAGIMMKVVGYVTRTVAISTTKTQIAAMSAALEAYKTDTGDYPRTAIGRVSQGGWWEATNNWILYRALSGANGGKRYLKFAPAQLRLNLASGNTNATVIGSVTSGTAGLTNIFDVWGSPYIYFCSPATVSALSNNFYGYPTNVNSGNGYWAGGQVNAASFDLFSFGPDRLTFVASNLAYGWWSDGPWVNTGWSTKSTANDDITNWKR